MSADADRPGNAAVAQLKSIIEYASDAVVGMDERGAVTLWNQRAEQLFGFAAEEIAGKPLADFIIPERFRAAHREGLERYLATGEHQILNQRVELSARRRDGREFPVELTVVPVRGGGECSFISYIHDISYRKVIEHQLKRELEQQNAVSAMLRLALEPIPLREMLEKVLDVMLSLPWLSLQAKGCIFVWDEALARLRLTAERHLAAPLIEQCAQVAPGHCLCGRAAQTRTLVFASDLDERHDTQYPAIRPHGHYCVPIQSAGALLGVLTVYVDAGIERNDEQSGFLQVAADTIAGIIARKRAEEELESGNRALRELNQHLKEAHAQLLQSEKLASIGQLAAGVAHEINNPVGYVQSNLGTLAHYVDELTAVLAAYEAHDGQLRAIDAEGMAAIDALKRSADLNYLKEDIAALVRESREGIDRVKGIVQDLREFSHSGNGDFEPADLHRGLESTLNVVWNELKYKADVVREFGLLPPVECLPQQINQVFMNLLVNAAHAIDGRGIITVRSGTDGDAAWIEIEDTGRGIAPEVMTRIFDPFFTTKPIGKGTGLGLSISYAIVKKHHGRIEVDSEPGRGTRFRLYLPIKAVRNDPAPL